MFVKVKLLKGFPKPLFYEIPKEWDQTNLKGTIIQVPIRSKIIPAIVQEIYTKLPSKISFEIKKALNIEPLPADDNFPLYVQKLSSIFFINEEYFYQRIRSFLFEKDDSKNVAPDIPLQDVNFQNSVQLTLPQQNVVDFVSKHIENPSYQPTLLYGVTGSGKTEVYKKLIIKSISENKTVIFLTPEVSLSLQFQKIFEQTLSKDIKIFNFHSASKISQKRELWEALLNATPVLILGVHLPILLPISNLGLIIVDEEHETNYQEKKSPKLNSKMLAIYRAFTYKIPIILGSATPSLSSLLNVKEKKWNLFELKERFGGEFPQIQKVFLKEKNRRSNFWISKELETEIKATLDKKEQALIFLNRRGFSFFVLCKECGFVFKCPNCSVSLTLHQSAKGESLQCHYCNYAKTLPANCPECKVNSENFIKKGIGTQQVVSILEKIFPQAKIERADLDTTSKKKKWHETVKKFETGEIDILVGTQTITKGYHFPNVTLVGVLWADLGLHFPVFNAIETNLQQLIQVAGRAGRQSKSSKVIMQVMQDHNVFDNLSEQNYLDFYESEIEFRTIAKYPPIYYLLQIEIKNLNILKIESDSSKIFSILEQKIKSLNLEIDILGPCKPPIYKIQKIEIRQIYLKSKNFTIFHTLLKSIDFKLFSSSIYLNINF
ncbi:TPA: primosomal protein N' [Candidatus Dependentiae bacterium]|nr:MAG: Primosome assembly protein PriA [candidate division TM6 bacterium GW2011_GWE2_31_21]KKP53842.1 MAG: Primosome assembly protein PriA [candidate division TM6 bacterium GW2011_GWF2_33_332]HBS47622.1 primosomal protein N' [Candidatus Dependentiae bacterium]HBZ73771.1 primosomal protein N' [Candidatus Dependentiae bacterium]